tara:strand:- start:172 stop:483 length:312 start_codon:yes stop_codon:yes gene_type:complete
VVYLAGKIGPAPNFGVFYFFPGQAPEFKKPESPGKAKKDYLPTSKRLDSKRFPGRLSGKKGWMSKLKTRVRFGRVARQTRGEKKKNVFSFMVKKNGFWRQMTI